VRPFGFRTRAQDVQLLSPRPNEYEGCSRSGRDVIGYDVARTFLPILLPCNDRRTPGLSSMCAHARQAVVDLRLGAQPVLSAFGVTPTAGRDAPLSSGKSDQVEPFSEPRRKRLPDAQCSLR